jgi:3-methyladenine DNA glycosylase AlkD
MPPLTARTVKHRLQSLADPAKATGMSRFFKTGPGQYGEGDVFLGIPTPVLRTVVRDSTDLPLVEGIKLLKSPIHEHRSAALAIWVMQFAQSDDATRRRIYHTYLAHTRWVNNWDLVDLSAPGIVGRWLATRSRRPLDRLVKSKSLWERRIAIVSTLHFIRQGDLQTTFTLAEHLLDDQHDLIHKAVGWMLREAYKRNASRTLAFLRHHAAAMPRTTFRYAIERCDQNLRQSLMRIDIEKRPMQSGVVGS